MDLATLTSGTPTTKPWMQIVANSVTTENLTTTNFNIQNLDVTGSLEVKGNSYVTGFAGSQTEAPGSIILSLNNGISTMPTGTGGAYITYDSTNDQVVVSALVGSGTSCYTTNGGVSWTAPTVPGTVPCTDYSSKLGIYCLIDGQSNSIWTSPTYHTGTFTSRTAYSGTFDGYIEWIPQVQQGLFVAAVANSSSVIATSPDGINFTSISSSRSVLDFAYSPSLNVFVVVGPSGPMYSTDGIVTLVNASSTFEMNAVCWSNYWNMFVAAPRSVNLTSIYTSTDGINWVQTPNVFPSSMVGLQDITWSDHQQIFVGVGVNENVWISQDGFNWKRVAVSSPGSNSWYCARYNETWGQWMIVGNQATARVTPKRFQPT